MSTTDNPDGSSLTRDVNDILDNSSAAAADASGDTLNDDVQTMNASDNDNVDGDDNDSHDDDEVPVIQVKDAANNDDDVSSLQDSPVAESSTSTSNDDLISGDPNTEPSKLTTENLMQLLRQERSKSSQFEEKLKHALADYQNLHRKTRSDIETGINVKLNEFALDFIKIYDDFLRAKNVFIESKINTEGMNSILKNMDSVLSKYNIHHIDALGEIFDPHLHEAISIVPDPNLDEGTITQELRRGYTSNGIVIRPTLVEITKKE